MIPSRSRAVRQSAAGSLLAVLAAFAAACGPSAHAFDPTTPPLEPSGEPATAGVKPKNSPSGSLENGTDAPEISRSVGVEGGVVALWPRIVPRATDAAAVELAHDVQQAVVAIKQAMPDVAVDVRPEPERVCPRAGCKGVAVGAVLARSKDACAVVATVSAPGASPARLVPWGGAIRLLADSVPFRDPPESVVKVSDFATCTKLAEAMKPHDAEVVAAVKSALGR